MSRRPWLRYPPPPVVVRPPLTCVNGPRFRTEDLARRSIPIGVPVSDETFKCPVCGGVHRAIDQTT